MNEDLKRDLLNCETDICGAMKRFSNNEALYISCLRMFLQDTTMRELDEALTLQAWDDAFTAAHALKGLAGNMGFVPLFHESAALVMLIRAGRTHELGNSYRELKLCYNRITAVINRYCGDGMKGV